MQATPKNMMETQELQEELETQRRHDINWILMNAPRVMALDTKVPTKTIICLEVGKSCLISYIFCSVPSLLRCLFWLAAQPAALSMLICRNCYCSFLLNIGQGEGGVSHFSVLMVSQQRFLSYLANLLRAVALKCLVEACLFRCHMAAHLNSCPSWILADGSRHLAWRQVQFERPISAQPQQWLSGSTTMSSSDTKLSMSTVKNGDIARVEKY